MSQSKSKYYYYQFDVSDSVSVRILSTNFDGACEIFKLVFGSVLFSQVKTIYNLNKYGI